MSDLFNSAQSFDNIASSMRAMSRLFGGLGAASLAEKLLRFAKDSETIAGEIRTMARRGVS